MLVMRTWLQGRLKWLVAALILVLAATAAYAMSVQPIIIDLQASGRRTSEVIRVGNNYSTPMTVEIRVFEAEYSETGIRTTERPSDDLLVFPPQAIIAPGRTQTFRIQYVGDPGIARSRHYIVSVAQVPVKLPEDQTAVQLLYNFNVVVGVRVPGLRPDLRVTQAEVTTEGDGKPRAAIVLQNGSGNYGYLANGSLRITQRDASGRQVYTRSYTDEEISLEIGYGLVGPGQTRRIVVPTILPQPGGSIEAQFTPTGR